jgi:hypothetical protein
VILGVGDESKVRRIKSPNGLNSQMLRGRGGDKGGGHGCVCVGGGGDGDKQIVCMSWILSCSTRTGDNWSPIGRWWAPTEKSLRPAGVTG